MDNTKTAVPTLTAEEMGMLASVRDDWTWEDNNRDEDAVVSQREYVENLRVTFAIIDRLLAAGAPTAASTATAVNRLKYAEQFLVAYDRTTPGSGWKMLGLRGYRRLKEILFAADPEFGRDMDCAEHGADAAPAAEGGGE